MRILTVSALIGPLLLMGALPGAAGQSNFALRSPPNSSTDLRLVAEDDMATKESYAQKARERVGEWRRKLDDFYKKAEAEGGTVDEAAKKRLDEAWTTAKADADKLQGAGAADWDIVKASFEKASQDLADGWHKINPDGK